MSCEEVQAARREELARLNVDSTAALQTCNQEFRATIEKLVQDTKGMSEEDVRLVLKQSRRELEGSTATLQQRIEEIIGDVREQEDDASWREWFKKTSKAAAAGLVTGAVAGASTYLAGGGDAATAAASLSAAGLVAYCAYYNINPVSWLMDKVRRAWQDPAWASICIQKFVAVKRIACEVINRVLLRLAAHAVGKTGVDRDAYVELHMGDIDRVAGSQLCGMLLSVSRTALSESSVVESMMGSVGGVLKKAVPAALNAYTGGLGGPVLSAVGSVFETSESQKLMSGVFEVVMMERALRNSLAQLMEIFDSRCTVNMLTNLATVHAAVCRYASMERTAVNDAQPDAGDDKSLVERLWSKLTSAARCPATRSFEMKRLTLRGTETSILKFLEQADVDEMMRAAIVEHIYVTKPAKRSSANPSRLLEKLRTINEATHNNDPDFHFILRVPVVDDALVTQTLDQENRVELDLLFPPLFASDFKRFEDRVPALLVKVNQHRPDRPRLVLATPEYDALCRGLAYRRLATLYSLNQKLWTSEVWDGSLATEYENVLDPASRAGKTNSFRYMTAYVFDALSTLSEKAKITVREMFKDNKSSITGGVAFADGASVAETLEENVASAPFASMKSVAQALATRREVFDNVARMCLDLETLDIVRYYAVVEFVRAMDLFLEDNVTGLTTSEKRDKATEISLALLQKVKRVTAPPDDDEESDEDEGEEEDEL